MLYVVTWCRIHMPNINILSITYARMHKTAHNQFVCDSCDSFRYSWLLVWTSSPTAYDVVLKQRIWRTAFVPAGGASETVPFRGQAPPSVLFSLRAGEQVYAQLKSGREICGDIWGRTSLADTYFYPTES